MIIGNGLIATALDSYKSNNDVIIFASGVSNSLEKDENNFDREKRLILEQCKLNLPIVYFSTCSIFDPSLNASLYVLHKLEMEKLIVEYFKKYYILRLPTLVGKTGNPNTFFNSITKKLKNGEPIIVYKKASRYLLDADDLPLIVSLSMEDKTNKKINIAFDNKIDVLTLVKYLQRDSNSEIQIVDKGNDFKIDNSVFLNFCYQNNLNLNSKSWVHILDKYIKYI